MIGKTLGIYISFRFLKVLLAMVLGLMFLIVTVDFVEQLRRTAEVDNVKLSSLYTISLFRAPIFVERIFPFACLFAGMITLTQLNSKMELVVARAAGISAWQFLLPIAISAALVGILVATIYNPLAIRAFEMSKDWSAEILGGESDYEAIADGEHWIKQEDSDGGLTFIRAGHVRRNGELLDAVSTIRFDPQGNVRERIDSRHAIYKQDSWLLVDATHTDSTGTSQKMDLIEIETRLSRGELFGIGTGPDEVPFWELTEVAERVEKSGTNGKPYLVHYHSLIALPLFLVAMTLVAATVCLRFVRFGQVARMILGGILFGFVLYTATTLVTALGSNGVVPPAVAAWAPCIVAVLFGTSMLLHQEDG